MRTQICRTLAASIAARTDPSSAARALTKQAEEVFATAPTESNIECGLRQIWDSIIHIAAESDHQSQEPLVAIVQEVQKQNFTKEDGTSELTLWNDKVKLWTDLPLFGPCVRDAWNRDDIAPGTASQDGFSAYQWCNLNAFLARLTSLSPSTPAFDFSIFGMWSLRSAVECPNDASPADLDAAKAWFIYAEDIIRKLSNEKKSFTGKIGIGGGNFADREWTGFSPQRLEIWQAALQ